MSIAERRLAMFDALLSGRGINGLVEAAAKVFGNPVAVADMGLSMVAVSKELSCDPEWALVSREGETNDIRQASLAGDFRRVYSSDKTVVGEYPGAAQRYLAARVRRGDVILGHALVLERNKPFSDEDVELLPDVCRTFGYELAGDVDTDQLSERHGRLFDDLLLGRVVDEDEVSARARRARLRLPDEMCLIVARPVSERGQVSARYLRTQLTSAFPGCMGVVRGDDVVAVVNAHGAREGIESFLSRSVMADSLIVGMSYPFAGLHLLARAFEQALACIRLAPRQTGVVRYEEVVARHLMERASVAISPETFIHPAIARLAELDRSEGTEHLDDLEAYLSCGRNATATARALHVHKNTMYYRLRRIEELAGVDLSDEMTCFALQLSLAAREDTRP